MTNHWQHALYSLFSHPQERIYQSNHQLRSHPYPYSSLLWILFHIYWNLPPQYWTPISPIPYVDLIEYYDQMFPTLESYETLWITD